MTSTRARIVRHESAMGSWELALGDAHPSIRQYVRQYCGWVENTSTPICRRELPTEIVPVIILFGAPVRILDSANPSRWTDYRSFVAGPSEAYALVSTTGPSAGLQIDFTIAGARLFLGRPLSELANTQVELDDVFGARGRLLTQALQDASSWDARFAIVDREIEGRNDAARAPSPAVLWAWRRLFESGGRTRIGTIVEETGCSQKHLIGQFRQEIGLTPKVLARILRFGRAVRLLKSGEVRLADVAYDCGYFDQAHFTRDFREFAGVTPSELLRSALPDGGGFSA